MLISKPFPFLKSTVRLQIIEILPAIVFDLFSFTVKQDQLRDSSNVIKFFESAGPFIRERKPDPGHLLGESLVLFLDLIESDIDNLDLLIFEVHLFVELFESRHKRLADVAL